MKSLLLFRLLETVTVSQTYLVSDNLDSLRGFALQNVPHSLLIFLSWLDRGPEPLCPFLHHLPRQLRRFNCSHRSHCFLHCSRSHSSSEFGPFPGVLAEVLDIVSWECPQVSKLSFILSSVLAGSIGNRRKDRLLRINITMEVPVGIHR